jgi:hypothetical protein
MRPVSVVTPATITHTGTDADANNNAAFATSITYTTIAQGDLVCLIVEEKYSAASNRKVASIASTRVLWQLAASFQRFMADGVHGVDIWYGTVLTVGSDTATITYTSTTGQQAGSITSVQLHASTGTSAVWAVDTSNFVDNNTSQTSMALPALTAALAKEAIVGYCAFGSSGTSSATSGYTYRTDPRGNQDAYNVNVGAGSVTPAAWTGSSQLWFSAAVLFQAT